MADICADGRRFEIGLLSKAKEDWVLVTEARIDGKLRASRSPPSSASAAPRACCSGLVTCKRTSKRDAVLKGLMGEAYHRALMAFPDEDVLVGTRFVAPVGLRGVQGRSTDIVPRPGHKAVGEERAWGRRLAKRFGVDASLRRADASSSSATASPGFLDHESLKPEKIDADVRRPVQGRRRRRGDSLIAFGWAMAEDLVKLGSRG